ncbi:MAG: SAF domain-containing protein [Acidimicrobiia bacterium]
MAGQSTASALPGEPERGGRRALRVLPAHARGPLLNPRSLLGALLVTASGVGLFVAASGDDRGGHEVVVASTDLRPGQVIDPEDLDLVRAELPGSIDVFANADDLVGRVVLGPIGTGELVQAAAVSQDRPLVERQREVAVTLPRDQVAVGRLRVGDRVDLFVTGDVRTTVVVQGAPVVHLVADDGSGLSAGRDVRLVVALEQDAAVAALVHALRTGEVTVVRSTFAAERSTALSHPPTEAVDDDEGAREE